MSNANWNSYDASFCKMSFTNSMFYVIPKRNKKQKQMLTKLDDAETIYQLNDGSQQLRTVKLCRKQQDIWRKVFYKYYKKKENVYDSSVFIRIGK